MKSGKHRSQEVSAMRKKQRQRAENKLKKGLVIKNPYEKFTYIPPTTKNK